MPLSNFKKGDNGKPLVIADDRIHLDDVTRDTVVFDVGLAEKGDTGGATDVGRVTLKISKVELT